MTQYEKLGKLLKDHKAFKRWLFWQIFRRYHVGVSKSDYNNPLAVFLTAKGIGVSRVARYDIFYYTSFSGQSSQRTYSVPTWAVDFLTILDEKAGAGTPISARECRRILDESLEKRMQIEQIKSLYSGDADFD